jgi:chromosome segregation ATPase
MAPGEVGSIRQQIGEILGTVKSMDNQLREVKDDSRANQANVRDDILRLQRATEETNASTHRRLEQLVGQVRDVAEKALRLTGELSQLETGVKETKEQLLSLKEPVDSLITLRNRLMAYVFVIVSIATVLWNILGPVLHTVVTRAIGM